MEAEVAVVGDFGLLVDVAGVVGAGRDAVLAPDAPIGIHGHDARGRVMVAGARRADLHAGRILALLARDADVVALGSGHPLKDHAGAPRGKVIGFVAGMLAFAAADALVLVEDHHVVRLLLPVRGSVGRAAAERKDNESADARREESSPVDRFSHSFFSC